MQLVILIQHITVGMKNTIYSISTSKIKLSGEKYSSFLDPFCIYTPILCPTCSFVTHII